MGKNRKKLNLKEILNPFNYQGENKNILIYDEDIKTPDIDYIIEKFDLGLKELDDNDYYIKTDCPLIRYMKGEELNNLIDNKYREDFWNKLDKAMGIYTKD